ncbi:sulfite exporter TauE/SafE family protein [Oleispirillum naphthae]|uniref:sulfite exporter TauE/SafE family protein n=1 Tax=Oleispirillum naphthae TaxID=2838853 RepID=UPI0030824BF5
MTAHMSLEFLLPFALALLATGAIAGTLAGVLGVGGGIVIVPVLYLLFPLLGIAPEVRMHLAVGTSLATIIPTSIMSARTHNKKGGLDWDLLKSLAPGIVIGVIAGSVFGGRARGSTLTLIFAVIALLVATHMAFKREGWTLRDALPAGPRFRVPLGCFIGGFSVMMGIGGGTLSVPILSSFAVPIRRAVGTASAIGLIIGLPGTVGYIVSGLGDPHLPPFSLGYANLLGFALIVPTTMLTAPIGARIAHAIDPVLLRKAFAFFLFVTSCRMFWGVFGH